VTGGAEGHRKRPTGELRAKRRIQVVISSPCCGGSRSSITPTARPSFRSSSCREEMGLRPCSSGLLGSSFAGSMAWGRRSPARSSTGVRRKTAILAGLHFWSLVCVATALSRNFRHLFLFRAAEGLGETCYFPASMSMISDYHGKATRFPRHGPAIRPASMPERSRAASSPAPSGSSTAGAGRSSSSAALICSASRSTPCSSSRSGGPPISADVGAGERAHLAARLPDREFLK